jgi:hypothetical protein
MHALLQARIANDLKQAAEEASRARPGPVSTSADATEPCRSPLQAEKRRVALAAELIEEEEEEARRKEKKKAKKCAAAAPRPAALPARPPRLPCRTTNLPAVVGRGKKVQQTETKRAAANKEVEEAAEDEDDEDEREEEEPQSPVAQPSAAAAAGAAPAPAGGRCAACCDAVATGGSAASQRHSQAPGSGARLNGSGAAGDSPAKVADASPTPRHACQPSSPAPRECPIASDRLLPCAQPQAAAELEAHVTELQSQVWRTRLPAPPVRQLAQRPSLKAQRTASPCCETTRDRY